MLSGTVYLKEYCNFVASCSGLQQVILPAVFIFMIFHPFFKLSDYLQPTYEGAHAFTCFFPRGLSQVLSYVSAIPPRNFRIMLLLKSVWLSQFTNGLRFHVAKKRLNQNLSTYGSRPKFWSRSCSEWVWKQLFAWWFYNIHVYFHFTKPLKCHFHYTSLFLHLLLRVCNRETVIGQIGVAA